MKKKIILSVAIIVLAVMLVSVFVACTPDKDKVDEKFKEEGYIGTNVTVSGYTGALYTKITETITIIWFENDDDAKEAYEELKSDDSKDNLCKRGKAIAFGSEGAIEIFKKII